MLRLRQIRRRRDRRKDVSDAFEIFPERLGGPGFIFVMDSFRDKSSSFAITHGPILKRLNV